jgi:hypothetical protein
MFQGTLTMPNVVLSDGGVYICTGSNGEARMDVLTMLTVNGAIPFLSQAPLSYITLPMLHNANLEFNIEILFKPDRLDGQYLLDASCVPFRTF